MSSPRVLVTGATGFLGGHVAAYLVRRGVATRCLVRRAGTGAPHGAEAVLGDLLDLGSLRAACRGMDVVVHCAALVSDWSPPERFHEVNVTGTRALAEACRDAGVRRLVHVSTLDVLGHGNGPVHEDDPPRRTGFDYPDTKGAAEGVVRAVAEACGLELAIVRPGWVYGPGDRHFLPEVADAIRSGTAVLIAGGRRPAPLVGIENLVPALASAGLEARAAGGVFHLVDAPVPTWADLFRHVARLLGRPAPRLSVPAPVAYGVAVAMETAARLRGRERRPLLTRYLVRYLSASLDVRTGAARDVLGFRTRVPLELGLERALR
jgi:nucleoside-diphosphate-sugar epimerase